MLTAFDQVSRPSLDPSAPLAWWDKVRLLFHGRLTLNCAKFTCLLHVSLDPYNTTEEMELTWTDLVLDWTNGKSAIFLDCILVFVRNVFNVTFYYNLTMVSPFLKIK